MVVVVYTDLFRALLKGLFYESQMIGKAQLLLLLLVLSYISPYLGIVASSKDSSRSCGELLVSVTASCTSSRYSELATCCPALQAWNDGLCWCEKNAFNAVSNLAGDYFAFQFRAGKCNITDFYHPDIALPVSGKGILHSTCPPGMFSSDLDSSEGCSVSPATLRKQRIEFLHRFNHHDLSADGDLSVWSKSMDNLLTPQASLFSIGFSFVFPRVTVKRYLLSRQKIVKSASWQTEILGDTLIWRFPGMVSYGTSKPYGGYSFARIDFVVFESCSPRIEKLFTQEEEAVRLQKQFVYFEPADSILWKLRRSPEKWCSSMKRHCEGDLNPFKSQERCIGFYQKLWQDKRVTCANERSKFAVLSLLGDTSGCRGMYLDLAGIKPKMFCRFLGVQDIGLCASSNCPANAYNDLFREPNPRFGSSAGYVCSKFNCVENWPFNTQKETSDYVDNTVCEITRGADHKIISRSGHSTDAADTDDGERSGDSSDD